MVSVDDFKLLFNTEDTKYFDVFSVFLAVRPNENKIIMEKLLPVCQENFRKYVADDCDKLFREFKKFAVSREKRRRLHFQKLSGLK